MRMDRVYLASSGCCTTWACDKTKSTRSNAHVWIMRRFGHFLLRLVRHGDFDHPAKGYQRVDFPCYFQNFEACPKWTKSSRSALFLFTWHEPSHLPVWLHWTQILMPSHTLNNYPIRWKARGLFDHLFSLLDLPNRIESMLTRSKQSSHTVAGSHLRCLVGWIKRRKLTLWQFSPSKTLMCSTSIKSKFDGR
jgi:hypothetical protein